MILAMTSGFIFFQHCFQFKDGVTHTSIKITMTIRMAMLIQYFWISGHFKSILKTFQNALQVPGGDVGGAHDVWLTSISIGRQTPLKGHLGHFPYCPLGECSRSSSGYSGEHCNHHTCIQLFQNQKNKS